MREMMRNSKYLFAAFLHVSTAYSNCPSKLIGEEFYPPPLDYKRLTGILEVLDDKMVDCLTPELLDKWPNTYALTKIVAESLVKEYGKGLPIGLLRPSIVVSTFKEPITGWINNYYGPQGVVFGAGLGLLRTLYCDPNVVADLVPVDLVISALIAFAWDLGQTRGDNPNFERISWKDGTFDDNSNVEKSKISDDIPILNYVSSGRNPITWGKFMEFNYQAGKHSYSPLQLWHSSITLNANKHVDFVYRYVCHYIPALIVDTIAVIAGKKPMLMNTYKKIDKFSSVLSYFCTSQWKFRDDNVIKLWNKMSEKDKVLFFFSIEDLDWGQYFDSYLKGIRLYLANDEFNTIPEGRKRARKLKIMHFSLVAVVNFLLLYLLWWIFSSLFL